jgi:putative membrane protein
MMHWDGGGGGWGWGGWLVMALMLLAFWGLVALVLVMLVRGPGHGPSSGGPSREEPGAHARHILEERLARGEIDADEYQKRRDLLRHR